MRPNTEITYKRRVHLFEKWLGDRQTSEKLALQYLHHLEENKKRNTVAVARNALVWKYSYDLPSYTVEVPEPQYLDVSQIKKLISMASPIEKAVIILMMDTGCRISEVLGLKLSQVEWDNAVVTVISKGGHKRRVALTDIGMQALRDWLKLRKAKSNDVFMDYSYHDFYLMFKELGNKCSLKNFHSHILRHSRAVHLLKSGVPLERVADILGHKSIEITRRIYGALRAEDLKQFLAKW